MSIVPGMPQSDAFVPAAAQKPRGGGLKPLSDGNSFALFYKAKESGADLNADNSNQFASGDQPDEQSNYSKYAGLGSNLTEGKKPLLQHLFPGQFAAMTDENAEVIKLTGIVTDENIPVGAVNWDVTTDSENINDSSGSTESPTTRATSDEKSLGEQSRPVVTDRVETIVSKTNDLASSGNSENILDTSEADEGYRTSPASGISTIQAGLDESGKNPVINEGVGTLAGKSDSPDLKAVTDADAIRNATNAGTAELSGASAPKIEVEKQPSAQTETTAQSKVSAGEKQVASDQAHSARQTPDSANYVQSTSNRVSAIGGQSVSFAPLPNGSSKAIDAQSVIHSQAEIISDDDAPDAVHLRDILVKNGNVIDETGPRTAEAAFQAQKTVPRQDARSQSTQRHEIITERMPANGIASTDASDIVARPTLSPGIVPPPFAAQNDASFEQELSDEILQTMQQVNFAGSDTETAESTESPFARLVHYALNANGMRRDFMGSVQQLVQQFRDAGKADTLTWTRHKFILDDGKQVDISVRQADGVLHLKLASANTELGKLLQQYFSEIKDHLAKEVGTEISLELDFSGNEAGDFSRFFGQENPASGNVATKGIVNKARLPNGGSVAQEIQSKPASPRSFGYNRMEWTA